MAKGKAKIIVDGGVQRGSDVLKAVALGADAVALGGCRAGALAAGGQAGVVRMLEILEDEMVCAMALAGLTSLSQLTPKYVCKADPVTTPHEMSAWVNMPGRAHPVGQRINLVSLPSLTEPPWPAKDLAVSPEILRAARWLG